MKELKALDILKDYLNAALDGDDFNKAAEIQQAITELQAAQTYMTCDGCAYVDHRVKAIENFSAECGYMSEPCRSCIRITTNRYCEVNDQ